MFLAEALEQQLLAQEGKHDGAKRSESAEEEGTHPVTVSGSNGVPAHDGDGNAENLKAGTTANHPEQDMVRTALSRSKSTYMGYVYI